MKFFVCTIALMFGAGKHYSIFQRLLDGLIVCVLQPLMHRSMMEPLFRPLSVRHRHRCTNVSAKKTAHWSATHTTRASSMNVSETAGPIAYTVRVTSSFRKKIKHAF